MGYTSFGDIIGSVGNKLGIRELGVSEWLNGQKPVGPIQNITAGVLDNTTNSGSGMVQVSSPNPVADTNTAPEQTQTNFTDPAMAAKAANDALIGQRKVGINDQLNSYNSMFAGLFGKADAAAADQAATTGANYGTQRTNLTDQYNQEVPGIDMSYYLGGIGDSSLRGTGLRKAEDALKMGIGSVNANEATDLAGIGKELSGLKSGYQADQNNIETLRNSANQSTDAAELLALQNDIAVKISGLQATTDGMNTSEGFRGQLRANTPTRNLSPIKATLTSLMNGAANPALKAQIGKQIVDNADLSQSQKDELYAQFINAPVA